jgi:hypothetical protein
MKVRHRKWLRAVYGKRLGFNPLWRITLEVTKMNQAENEVRVGLQPNDETNDQLLSDKEYEDFHVFYHKFFDQLSESVFRKKDDIINYPILLQLFSVMHQSATVGTTAYEVVNDHLSELVDTLLDVLFGQNHTAGDEPMTRPEPEKG